MFMTNKTYAELVEHSTFVDRFNYLKLDSRVGSPTFGYDRYINQGFYMSNEWKRVRRDVVWRDQGCDLGVPGYEIHKELLVHHMNPIVIDDIIQHEQWILDPEFLITTTKKTHNALHFGTESMFPNVVTSRTPNDTKLW